MRPVVTHFANLFLTLASIHKHRNALISFVVSDEWTTNRLSASVEGKQVVNIILSQQFWANMKKLPMSFTTTSRCFEDNRWG